MENRKFEPIHRGASSATRRAEILSNRRFYDARKGDHGEGGTKEKEKAKGTPWD